MDNQSALLPIDFRNTPQPWNCWLNTFVIGFCFAEFLRLQECKTPASYQMMLYKFTYRAYILHWVIKLRWDSKHKIPNVGAKKTFKPLGEIYSVAVSLCMECHFINGHNYPNAADWFCYVLLETALSDIHGCNGKDAQARALQAQNKQLRSLQNPFCPEKHPHTWLLIESAIALANRSDRFRSTVWGDFLAARSNWIREYKTSEWIHTWPENGRIIGQVGRGKNTRKINIKNPLFETLTE